MRFLSSKADGAVLSHQNSSFFLPSELPNLEWCRGPQRGGPTLGGLLGSEAPPFCRDTSLPEPQPPCVAFILASDQVFQGLFCLSYPPTPFRSSTQSGGFGGKHGGTSTPLSSRTVSGPAEQPRTGNLKNSWDPATRRLERPQTQVSAVACQAAAQGRSSLPKQATRHMAKKVTSGRPVRRAVSHQSLHGPRTTLVWSMPQTTVHMFLVVPQGTWSRAIQGVAVMVETVSASLSKPEHSV